MPKVPIDYSNTIIYKIVCKDVDIKECYVGQTTNFSQRKIQHKSDCNKNHDIYVYNFIREHNGWDNWDMIEVEKYNALDKLDAHKRERYWIETLEAKLNKVIPTRTDSEWYQANKEQLRIKSKEFREQHKEKLKIKSKEYREKNNEQVKERKKIYYSQPEIKELKKISDKLYREQHQEEIKLSKKLWQEKNKDRISAERKLKYKLKKDAQA